MSFATEQSASTITLDDGTVITACERCRKVYEGKEEEPPCTECRVDLQKENEEVARIFMMVRGQVRTIGTQVVDLDFNAVKVAMDLFHVKYQRDVFERVRTMFFHDLKLAQKQNG